MINNSIPVKVTIIKAPKTLKQKQKDLKAKISHVKAQVSQNRVDMEIYENSNVKNAADKYETACSLYKLNKAYLQAKEQELKDLTEEDRADLDAVKIDRDLMAADNYYTNMG
jgi:hypothetical protein